MKAKATLTTIRKPATKTAASKPAAKTPVVTRTVTSKPAAARKTVSKPATKSTAASKSITKASVIDKPVIPSTVVSKPVSEATKPMASASPAVEKPGVILARKIAATNLTLQAFAGRIGVKPIRLTAIISGKRRLTADTALRLGLFLNENPATWMSYQAACDLEEMTAEIGGELARIVPLAKSEAEAA